MHALHAQGLTTRATARTATVRAIASTGASTEAEMRCAPPHGGPTASILVLAQPPGPNRDLKSNGNTCAACTSGKAADLIEVESSDLGSDAEEQQPEQTNETGRKLRKRNTLNLHPYWEIPTEHMGHLVHASCRKVKRPAGTSQKRTNPATATPITVSRPSKAHRKAPQPADHEHAGPSCIGSGVSRAPTGVGRTLKLTEVSCVYHSSALSTVPASRAVYPNKVTYIVGVSDALKAFKWALGFPSSRDALGYPAFGAGPGL